MMNSSVLYECFIDNRIRHCFIIRQCKKNKYGEDRFLVSIEECPNREVLLKAENINFQDSDAWRQKINLKIESRVKKQIVREIDDFLSGSRYEEPKLDSDHKKALQKNERLSEILHDKRETMCGMGTRKVKLTLNKLIKQGNRNAELYRKALEVEDCNIRAKESSYYYKDKIYRQKSRLLMELVDLCLKYDVVFGKQMVEGRETNCILYFELPFVEQISFHTTLGASEIDSIPDYQGQWDGKTCSTLDKLESALMLLDYNKNYSRLY